MTASQLLRQARRSDGLSQRDLAGRSDVRQPAIAAIESGAHDPGVGRLARLLASSGHRLAVLPTRANTVADIADAVYECLRHGDERRAYRYLIQLNDELVSEHGAVRVALTVTSPAPVGDQRFDAYIAALVEHHLRDEGLPLPTWVGEPTRRLVEPWQVDEYGGAAVEAVTPRAFRDHGVWLDPAELISV